MKQKTIVVLDGGVVNPGDLSWEEFSELGNLHVYEKTDPCNISRRIREHQAEILLVNKSSITKQNIEECPSLEYIGMLSTGYNNMDLHAASKANILISNVRDYCSFAVAQMVFAMILGFCNRVDEHSRAVYAGEWSQSQSFCFWKTPLIELNGKILGLFGFGAIAQKVAKIGESLGMKVLAHTRSSRENTLSIEFVSFDRLLEQSDFLSIHSPLSEQTRNIFNRDTLAQMKSSAYLLNTARGAIVSEKALKEVLNENRLAGYACDVMAQEPILSDSPLLDAKNCIITPHIAWSAVETRSRLLHLAADNLRAYLLNQAQNIVNE